jgi:hypothetical protein
MYIRFYSQEGDVERAICAAKRYLKEAGLSRRKENEIKEELRGLLLSGFEAEALKNLEEAWFISQTWDASRYVMRMHIFLFRAGIEEEAWLKENSSSAREIKMILRRGERNKKKTLSVVKMEKIRESYRKKRDKSEKHIKKAESSDPAFYNHG